MVLQTQKGSDVVMKDTAPTSHPPADPAKWSRAEAETWKHMKDALGWTGTEDQLLRALERLAREKGIDIHESSTTATS